MEIEELRNSAMAYYESLPDEQKTLAYDIFRALDADGDGSVSLSEFLEFLREADIYEGDPSDTFTMFDRDGNGRLDFNEVIVLFYYVTIGPDGSSWQQRSSRRRKRGLRGGRRGDRQGRWERAFDIWEKYETMQSLAQSIGTLAQAGCSIL